MNIFNETYLKVDYHEENNCLIAIYNGYINSENWRKYHNILIDFFKNNDAKKILVNTKKLGIVPKNDVDWTSEYVTPILTENGLQYVAFVIPDDEFAKMTTDTYVNEAKNLLTIKYFDNLEKAEEWIFEK